MLEQLAVASEESWWKERGALTVPPRPMRFLLPFSHFSMISTRSVWTRAAPGAHIRTAHLPPPPTYDPNRLKRPCRHFEFPASLWRGRWGLALAEDVLWLQGRVGDLRPSTAERTPMTSSASRPHCSSWIIGGKHDRWGRNKLKTYWTVPAPQPRTGF